MTHVESTDLDPLMQGEAASTLPEEPLSPQARLDASRAALRLWIDHTYHPERLTAAEAEQASEAHMPRPAPDEPAWLGVLVDTLSDVPVASIAVRYLRRWWANHPLHVTAQFAGAAGHELLGPTAKKHPWLLVGGAAVAGAAIARLRPWRWISGSAILASLIPPISLASILSTATSMFHGDDADAAEASNDELPDAPPGAPIPSEQSQVAEAAA